MLSVLITAVIVATPIWVYLDATRNGVGKIAGAGGMFNMSAGAWATVVLLLWVVGFPLYLLKRRSLIERAAVNPVGVKGRGVKVAILAVIGGVLILSSLVGMANATPPLCDSREAVDLVGKVFNDIPVARANDVSFLSFEKGNELGYNEAEMVRDCTAVIVTTAGREAVRYRIEKAGVMGDQFTLELMLL